jgi:hypothetical protein
LDEADEQIIDRYARKELAFPVAVKEISKIKGKRLVAQRPIRKGEFVATYSGNGTPKSMHSRFFMNHTTQVVLTKNGPLILILASKEIPYSKELLYNYNAYVKMYNTNEFV